MINVKCSGRVTIAQTNNAAPPQPVSVGDAVEVEMRYDPEFAELMPELSRGDIYRAYLFPTEVNHAELSVTIGDLTWSSSGRQNIVSVSNNAGPEWVGLEDTLLIRSDRDHGDTWESFPGLVSETGDHGLRFWITENIPIDESGGQQIPDLLTSTDLPSGFTDLDISETEGFFQTTGQIFSSSAGFAEDSEESYRIRFEVDLDSLRFGDGAPVTVSAITATTGEDENIFAITRYEIAEGATVYVSTVQDRGFINDGVYEGLLNEPLTFAAGESSRFVTVDWLESRNIDTDQSFSLIVQAHPDDPVDTHLARTSFTVPTSDDAPVEPGDDPSDPPSDPLDPEVLYRPTTEDLEYLARALVYGRTSVSADPDYRLLEAAHSGDWARYDDLIADYRLPEGYVVDEIFIEPGRSVADPGFLGVGLTSETGEPILAMRGTAGAGDWIDNLDAAGVGYRQVEAVWEGGSYLRV